MTSSIDSAPARRLPFTGTPNFRDLGGYPTADGRRVKWGHLYRSGQLSALTDADTVLLMSLQLDVVCDFRRVDEQEKDPSRLPEPGPRMLSLPITPGSNASFFGADTAARPADRTAMHDFMLHINRDFALQQNAAYTELFQHLLQEEPSRILFHCAAGKDRTGFAAAIILLALGVSRECVMEDYLLTAEYFVPEQQLSRLQEKYELDLDADAVMPVLEVQPRYLQAAFDAIDEEFASLESYLESHLQLDDEKRELLREHYLE